MRTIKMKTIGLVLSLMVTTGIFAQDFHYGVKGGVNMAVQSQLADYYDNSDIRTGLSAGVFGNMAFDNGFALQTEVNYEQKGGKKDNITTKYDYISVPVLAKYSMGTSDRTALKFNINAGPYASFLVNGENEIDTDGIKNTVDMKDNTENVEFGVITGFGMEYPIGDNSLTFDIRLGLGLTAFDKANSDQYNKYVGITLGYQF